MKTRGAVAMIAGLGLAAMFTVTPALLTAQETDKPERGFQPARTYSVSEMETVNTTNGNLIYEVPLASLPVGRGGMSLGVKLLYNSGIYDTQPTWETTSDGNLHRRNKMIVNPNSHGFSGWQLGYEYRMIQEFRATPYTINPSGHLVQDTSCTTRENIYTYKISAQLPDGSIHPLVLQLGDASAQDNANSYYFVYSTWGQPSLCSGKPVLTGTLVYYSVDGSFLRVEVNTATQQWVMYLPDGTKATNGVTGATDAVNIEDRNGNSVQVCQDYQSNQPFTTRLVEVLNKSAPDPCDITMTPAPRYVEIDDSVGGSQTVWTYGTNWGAQGHPQVVVAYTIHWVGLQIPYNWYQCENVPAVASCILGGDANNVPYSPVWLSAVSSIDLPTGVSYSFDYDISGSGWGELNSVARGTTSPPVVATYQYKQHGLSRLYDEALYNPVVSKQYTVTGDVSQTWSYNYSPSHNSTAITNPDGGVVTYSYVDPRLMSNTMHGLVTSIVQPNGDSLSRAWALNVAPGLASDNVQSNPYVQSETQTIGSGAKSAVKQYTRDKNGNLTSVTQGNWGGGTLWQTTNIYVAYTPGADTSPAVSEANAYWNSGSPRVRWPVKSTRVSGSGMGSYAEYGYDGASNLLTEMRWDSTKGAQTAPLTSGNSISITRTYDGYGNLATVTDARNVLTQYTPDSEGLCVTQIATAGHVTGRNCDPRTGLVSDETQVDGASTAYNIVRTMGYDALGRLTNLTEASGSATAKTTTTQYDDVNRIVTMTTPLDSTRNLVTVNSYDELGRLVKTQTPDDDGTLNIAVDRLYQSVPGDAASYEAVSNPYCSSTTTRCSNTSVVGWTRTKRDQNGRVIEVQTFDGLGQPGPWGANTTSTGSVTTAYSVETTTVTDQAVKARMSAVDAAGRVVSVVEDPNGTPVTTSYGYDALDDLTGVNPGGGAGQRERTFAYDSLKRLSSATNPESGTVSYTYDANGNLKTKTDARGVVASFNYDDLNRVYLKSYTIPGGAADPTESVTYCYDGQVANTGDGVCTSPASAISYGWNRLTEVRTATSTTTYTSYDALGRVMGSKQTTGGTAYPFSYLYNLAGGLTGVQYPSMTRNVSYTYTGAGRIDAVWKGANGSGGNYASSIKYTPHGAATSMTLDGSGLTEARTYNSRLQPVSIQAGSLLTLGYSYCPGGASMCSTNNNGNVQRQTITAGSGFTRTIDYTYADPMNRLSSAIESGGNSEWSETYGYNPYGNRWVSDWGPALPPSGETPTSSSWFDTNNRLTGVTYDAAGNQQSLASFGIAYDAENRQTKTTINSATSQYAYDGDGRRVKKVSAAGVTTVYVYDAMGELAAEYGASTDSGTSYLTTDHLGSTRLISDGHTVCKKRYDYRPFGEDIPVGIGDRSTDLCYGVADPTTIQFTGKERDSETVSATTKGLDNFGVRYFSGPQGRFTSPDEPLIDQWEQDPQSWNLYTYVRNNPLRYRDLDGRACTQDKEGNFHGDCSSPGDEKVTQADTPQTVNINDQSSGIIGQLFFAAVGHHGLPDWSKIPSNSPAFRFFSRWFTGPLQNPQANYYDALHRSLNGAARDIANKFLQQAGKNSLGELTKTEVKQLAQQLLDSKAPGVQNFMTRLEQLNPGATGTLRGLINTIDFGSGFLFMVPGQQQLLNFQTCGASTCGGGQIN